MWLIYFGVNQYQWKMGRKWSLSSNPNKDRHATVKNAIYNFSWDVLASAGHNHTKTEGDTFADRWKVPAMTDVTKRMQPWGEQVLIVRKSEICFPSFSFMCWLLSERRSAGGVRYTQLRACPAEELGWSCWRQSWSPKTGSWRCPDVGASTSGLLHHLQACWLGGL